MRAGMFGMAVALSCCVGLAAQSATVTQETKIEVEDGEDVVVTGCLGRSASGDGFVLSDVESKDDDDDVTTRSYLLVGEAGDLEEHVGHLVEIEGQATDESGEIEVTTKTEVQRSDADDEQTETKTEISGDMTGLPYLGVDELRMLRSSCR